ncbi:50S ribosomal protein L22 [Candidatus Falkowbacteria bacterium]|nr:50S ribosomal protein L22 [Candidatus Falkowbacteria bacterium]
MQVKANLNFLRMSPKKVRWVASLVRGMKVEQALIQLEYLNKAAAKPIIKLINSAIANASHNFNLKKENLYIKEIKTDMAGALKRWAPKAHGRATPVLKRLSHISLILEELVPTKKKVGGKAAKKKEEIVKVKSLEEIKQAPKSENLLVKEKEAVKPEGHDKEINKEIIDVRMEGKHRHKQQEEKRTMKRAKGFIKKIFSRKAG